MGEVLSKLTTRNILALAITATVLATVVTFITNPERLLVTLEDKKELVIGGALVFGIFLAKWSDIIQFYFRKPGTN